MLIMSREYSYYPEGNLEIHTGNKTEKVIKNIEINESLDEKSRVDINQLLNKVRVENKKKKKENLVFFGLISSVILITGFIVSL
jgi:hypothetical protein|tara:strand:- start:406 stop:657 length:252 start_codon:yes stop_codon:yes gene_type:complete